MGLNYNKVQRTFETYLKQLNKLGRINVKNHATAIDISEFYRQLALLTASNLPLPEILGQMNDSFKSREFKKALKNMSNDTAQGQTLATAMRCHPQLFSEDQIKLIEIGERNGILTETLQDVAVNSINDCRMVQMFKDIITYPIIIMGIAIVLLVGLSLFIIPEFRKILEELLEGEPLPSLTQMIFDVSYLINKFIPVVLILYGAFLGFSIWLLSSSRRAGQLILGIADYFPYATIINYNSAMAKVCSLWALFMRKKIPVEEAFPIIAEMIRMPQLQQALNNIAQNCHHGSDLQTSIEAEADIAQLLKMVVRNSPEAKLPEDLDKLAPIFNDRSLYGCRQLRSGIEIFTILSVSIAIGIVIIILFAPIMLGGRF
jgi:type IV pilus assembly protein PilC